MDVLWTYFFVIKSGCHIRPEDGIVEYYEHDLERVQRFKMSLKDLGDFTNEPTYVERDKLYRLKLPSPYGRALIVWELPSGDRTIQNPELPSDFGSWSTEAKRRYSSEMTAEEANISSGRCLWPRSKALRESEMKKAKYGFIQRITDEEVELIREKGTKRPTDSEGKKNITMNHLEKLTKSEDSEISETALRLKSSVERNRNRLIDDERDLHADLGIEVDVHPAEVALYEGTGRVTVKWIAKTASEEATIRLSLICRPNHPEKEVALKKWLSTRKPEDIQRILEELENEGYDVSDDWRDYVQ